MDPMPSIVISGGSAGAPVAITLSGPPTGPRSGPPAHAATPPPSAPLDRAAAVTAASAATVGATDQRAPAPASAISDLAAAAASLSNPATWSPMVLLASGAAGPQIGDAPQGARSRQTPGADRSSSAKSRRPAQLLPARPGTAGRPAPAGPAVPYPTNLLVSHLSTASNAESFVHANIAVLRRAVAAYNAIMALFIG